MARRTGTHAAVDPLRDSFEYYDKDKSGKLSLDEIESCLEKLNLVNSVTSKSYRRTCKRLINEFDTDNDGALNFRTPYLSVILGAKLHLTPPAVNVCTIGHLDFPEFVELWKNLSIRPIVVQVAPRTLQRVKPATTSNTQ